jgi:hypothetical protein
MPRPLYFCFPSSIPVSAISLGCALPTGLCCWLETARARARARQSLHQGIVFLHFPEGFSAMENLENASEFPN